MLEVTLMPPRSWGGHGDIFVTSQQQTARQTIINQLQVEWLPLHVLNIAREVGYGSCPLPHVSVTEHSHDGEHRVIGELRIGVVFAGIAGDVEEDQFLYEFLDVLCAGLGIHLLMFENHGLGLLPLRVECSTSSYGSVTRFDHINMVTGCIKTLATIDASGISS